MNVNKPNLFVSVAITLFLTGSGVVGYLLLRDSTPTSAPTSATNTSIKEIPGGASVDFGLCTPDYRRIFDAQGSTTIQVTKKTGNNCLINYGEEVENPAWDGKLDKTCSVPVSQGTMTFTKTGMGLDISSLSVYCRSS